MSDKCIPVCLRCKATVDMGCCLCHDGQPGETDMITGDEHTAWKAGNLPACLGGGDQSASAGSDASVVERDKSRERKTSSPSPPQGEAERHD